MITSPHLSLGYKLVFPQSQLALVHYRESLLLHTSCYSLFGFLLVKSSINIKNKNQLKNSSDKDSLIRERERENTTGFRRSIGK